MNLIIEIAFILVILIILICYIFSKKDYSILKEISSETNLSGFEIAKSLSTKDPHIIKKNGFLLDHYNSKRNVIKLSPDVFDDDNMYSVMIAIYCAYETNNKAQNYYFLNSFLVIASYFNIIIGGFLNNSMLIHFGFIIFIIAFLIAVNCITKFTLDIKDIKPLIKKLKTPKFIDNLEKYHNEIIVLNLRTIATLPYYFINYFR